MMRNNKAGFTLVEIMITVAIVALLAAIAIPNLVRAKVTANDTASLAFLKSLSTALETYAAGNVGRYPVADSLAALAASDFATSIPPFLSDVKLTSPQFGHNILFAGSVGGYQVAANVVTPNRSGVKNFRMSTGSVAESEDCSEPGYTVTAP
ncbi:MAG: prepilin-type N-terminal cleavage/methylation domain-containing protein [Deltaproteobacteria bacterium]